MPTKKENLMQTMFGTLKATLGIAILATVFAPLANAQCVSVNKYKRSALKLPQPFSSGELRPAAFMSVGFAAQEDAQGANQDPVVGFWKVTFVAEGNSDGPPDGTVIDSAYAQWHSDGTEIMNSSRPPATQSFCLGVWEKTGPSKYTLNHFAISWNPDGTLLGPANIRETITLSHDHGSFAGTFTIDQYNTGGNLLVHLTGQIEGKRITVNTSIIDVL